MPKAIHERSSIHGASQFMPFRAIHYGHARITYVNPSLSRVPIGIGDTFLVLGMVLPLLTGQMKEIGASLLPMHLAVMLCGAMCGREYRLSA